MFKTDVYEVVTKQPGRLVVIVPAMGQNRLDWNPLVDRLKAEPELAGADWVTYTHNLHFFSTRRLHDVAWGLAAKIQEMHDNIEPYKGITLIGHGVGGLLVRMAYLIGLQDQGGQEWTRKVDRIILFATLNRGFDPKRWGWFSGPLRGLLLIPWFRTARSYMKGSSPIAELRISWIKYFRQFQQQEAAVGAAAGSLAASAVESGAGSPVAQTAQSWRVEPQICQQPTVIQVNGVHDTYLDEEDNADIDQFPRAKQVRLQGVGRKDTYRLPKGAEEERYASLRHLILTAEGTPDSPHTDPRPRDIVFLVHGIRACSSGWPARAAAIVKRDHPGVIPVSAGYRYFSALNFALPFMRRMQIRWMQDEYSDRFAKYPNARFYFLGHSNGTYLLGRMVSRVPSAHFERVTLAGSVLPEDFAWKNLIGRQVGEYQNHRSARDMPVGLLCNMLRGLLMRDIGTGGFGGFLQSDDGQEVYYYAGGHNAAIKTDDNLARLIHYTLTGEAQAYSVSKDAAPGAMALVSRMMPIVAALLVLVVALGLYQAWLATAIVLVVLGIILKVM